MFLARWRARRANQVLIDQIHGEIVAAARAPTLFIAFAVPDDLDGRFEMVALHAGLVLRRWTQIGENAATLSQGLVDSLFLGFEDALREMSISDVGVAKRIKSMAQAFYGRNKVYADALDAADARALAAALARNVYRAGNGPPPLGAAKLAAYVERLDRAFRDLPIEAFEEGKFRYPILTGDAA